MEALYKQYKLMMIKNDDDRIMKGKWFPENIE